LAPWKSFGWSFCDPWAFLIPSQCLDGVELCGFSGRKIPERADTNDEECANQPKATPLHEGSKFHMAGYDSIRRRIIRFSGMILAPLVLRIRQDLDLLWHQQRPDLPDGCLSVWLETRPDLLQLAARGQNLCRVLR
jgi:hypothetical protein